MEGFEALWRRCGAPVFGPWAHPYYIWTPAYTEKSSGIRALYYLCHLLNSLGFEAYVTSARTAPELRAPCLTKDLADRHRALGLKPIVVYPEIVKGNPLNASVAARYLLFHPGHHDRHVDFLPWELIFSYLREYVPDGVGHGRLFIPTSDPALFDSAGTSPSQRTYVAFYANRFLQTGDPLEGLPSDAIELSPRVPARSLRELAALFRKTRVLYSYEWSSICYEAMLCGCPVALVPNRYLFAQTSTRPASLGDQVPFFETHEGNGICIGTDEALISAATASVARIREIYARMTVESLGHLETFIRTTQASANRMANKRWHVHHAPGPGPAPSGAEATREPVAPSVVLNALFDSFCKQVNANDWPAARGNGEQLDGLLGNLMAEGKAGPVPGKAAQRAVEETPEDVALAHSMMLKMSGLCFLRGQHLLTLLGKPEASAPLFRIAAQFCDADHARSRNVLSQSEVLRANALYHECVALGRAGAGAERETRLKELTESTWSDPTALQYVERSRKLLDEPALVAASSHTPV